MSWNRVAFQFEAPAVGSKLEVRLQLSGTAGESFTVEHKLRQDEGDSLARWSSSGALGPQGEAAIVSVGLFHESRLVLQTGDDSFEPIRDDGATAARVVEGTRGTSSAALESAAASDDSQRRGEFVVHYGTNRSPSDPKDPSKGYSSHRDTRIHYGTCKVFVPKGHKIGSIGSPWWKRWLTLSDDRLRILEIQQCDGAVHWESLAAKLRTVTEDERDGVIFVHGYNVSFEAAALRAAQLGVDLGIKGAMAFFSWPSKGTLADYPADEATIEASEPFIADYLTDFARNSGARRVHVIAHSMGNRGVLRAMNRITAKASAESAVRFGQIILAAADVDADTFRHLAAAYQQVASRTTLYVSTRDRAVEASSWLHDYPRAGLMPPVLLLPGIDTINVTSADLTMLGHGYVANARGVLADIHSLIINDQPPARRFGLRQAVSDEGGTYWLIGS